MNDGGPAFPCSHAESSETGIVMVTTHHGMSLRDYFAAFAMLGEMIRESTGRVNECGPYSGRSKVAYLQADSMLEEREKHP